MNFNDIPEISHQPMFLSTINVPDDSFAINLQKISNTLTCDFFPFVASLSLKYIDEELAHSLDTKQKTFKKLKKKYSKRKQNVNFVHDIIIDDYEMAIEDNVQLIPNAHANLMKTSNERNLISIIIKKFEQKLHGKDPDKEYINIYKFLQNACEYEFTQLDFSNSSQTTLDEHLTDRIIQVWQIFQQFFAQFDYNNYLVNYYAIKNKTNTRYILSIIRILLEIGPINC